MIAFANRTALRTRGTAVTLTQTTVSEMGIIGLGGMGLLAYTVVHAIGATKATAALSN